MERTLRRFGRLSSRFSVLLSTMLFLCGCLWVLLFPFLRGRADTTFTVTAGSGRIEVSVRGGPLQLSEAQLRQWVQNAAESVVAYYGRFPIAHVFLVIQPTGGAGVHGGTTFPDRGGSIRIHVGSHTTEEQLNKDWTLTHEMIHLAFPSVAEDHHWIEEGISVYVEPIARIQAGHFSERKMWGELVRDLPNGMPKAGDRGLDHTHTWGRTYWGGALFCFLAEVEIRKQTHNEKGLEDALRGILDAGGDIRKDWDLEDALRIGDRATGTGVLMKLYGTMKDRPMEPDLPELWKQLGVRVENGEALFDDDAPLAEIRKAITAARKK
jgi:hypothetical protein